MAVTADFLLGQLRTAQEAMRAGGRYSQYDAHQGWGVRSEIEGQRLTGNVIVTCDNETVRGLFAAEAVRAGHAVDETSGPLIVMLGVD